MRAAPLLLAALLLAPVALADHVFSHRLYVVGRVVDEAGVPVLGASVSVSSQNVRAGGACIDAKPAVTGPHGDFELCRHAHALPENGTITVRVEGFEETVALDHDLRRVAVLAQLPGSASGVDIGGWREFNRTYLVTGRHFGYVTPPTNAEGVMVNATPIVANVSAQMLAGGEVVAAGNATPNEHGDFRVPLAIEEVPPNAIVRVVSAREVAEKPASPLFRRTDVQLVRDDRLAQVGPGPDAPGTSVGEVPLPAWALVAALATAAALAPRARRR